MASVSTRTTSMHPVTDRSALGVGYRQWLGLILASHFLLAMWYSLVIPPWEAHDEWAHFRHAAYIAENLALPDPSHRLTTEFEFDEASQPPLYYILAAAPMLAVDTQDGYRPQVNPYATRGNGEGGVNFALHDPLIESWPWRGALLALHLGRFMSVLISTASLFITYALVRLLAPESPGIALVATAIQSFAPQFVFLSAVMTNDILLVGLETTILYAALRLVREGPRPRLALALGLVTALSLLTKYLAMAMAPVAFVALLFSIYGRRRTLDLRHRRNVLISLAVLLGPSIVLGGLWLARNLTTTGMLLPRDPYAIASLGAGLQGQKALALDWAAIPPSLFYGFRTYWASFGWGNIGAPDWVYLVWLALTVAAGIGLLLWLRSAGATAVRPLLVVAILYVLAAVTLPLLRELLHESSFLRGRYILSTLPVAAWVLAQGWHQLSGRFWPWVQRGLILWPAALSLALLPLLIAPAYAMPPTLAKPVDAPGQEINARFGDAVKLLRADFWPTDGVAPGDGLAVTLTWQVLARTIAPYTLAIHLTGAGIQSYGNVTSYPGHGNAATTIWNPGDIFSETYWLVVEPGGPTPAHGQVEVSFFLDKPDGELLPVLDNRGRAIGQSVRFGDLRIRSPQSAGQPTPVADKYLARFDNLLLLTDARLPNLVQHAGWAMPVVLRWQALGATARPIKATIQLLDANGHWIAGSDGDPGVDLPSNLWRAGDALHATRWLALPLELPPGRYRVVVAAYYADDMSRLPAIDQQGTALFDNALLIDQITVE